MFRVKQMNHMAGKKSIYKQISRLSQAPYKFKIFVLDIIETFAFRDCKSVIFEDFD